MSRVPFVPTSFPITPLVLAILTLTTALFGQNSSIFNGPRDYLVGGRPESIAVADFNRDQRADIAVANQVTNNISVLLQNSDGSFGPAVNYAVGRGPVSLQAGDINNDGKTDLVTLNVADGTVGVLLGNGDGTFQAQRVTALSLTPLNCMVIGDFNGDGKLDLAVGVPTPQVNTFAVAVMLGNGDGTFQAPVNYPINGQASILVASDLNNDGKLDLAVSDTTISVLLGNGDGSFQAVKNTSISGGANGLVIADFNQDGVPDIATSEGPSFGSNLALLLGNGDGTFQVSVLTSISGEPVAAGDLNGDGKPDLILQSLSPLFLEVFSNGGNGTFAAGQVLAWPGITNVNGLPVALSDFGNGQRPDLVVALPGTQPNNQNLPDIVTVFRGNGNGTFVVFPSYPPPAAGALGISLVTALDGSPVVGDFNADGRPDLGIGIVSTSRSTADGATTYLNTQAGFGSAITTKALANASDPPAYLAIGDFNHDGKPDLALSTTPGVPPGPGPSGISILLGNGDGTFQQAGTYAATDKGPLAVGDFDNDGKLDVIGIDSNSLSPGISVLLGKGDGTFGFPVNSALGTLTNFAVGDFDRDGKLDVAGLLAVTGAPPELKIFFGNGDGTFSAGPAPHAGGSPVAIATGDINHDGILDLVIGNQAEFGGIPSNVSILLGNGDGSFQNPIVTTSGNEISSIAISDFNLDGKQDVLIANTGWNDVGLLLGNGDGTLQPAVQFYLGNSFGNLNPAYNSLAVADFDLNGGPDVAVAGSTGVSLLLNTLGNAGPAALLSANTLSFGNLPIGQTSSAQNVTLSYNGSTDLSISAVTISGSAAGDFQQTDDCGNALRAGATCTISVIFSPQNTGTRSATLQISDSASNSPQTVSLSGSATGLGLTVGPNGSASATVSAGETATYTLAIGGAGTSGTATFTCSGAPAGAVCTVPTSQPFSANTPTTFTVSVSTVAARAEALRRRRGETWMWATFLLAGIFLFSGIRPDSGHKRRVGYLSLLLSVFLLLPSCGGGSGGSSNHPGGGTPSNRYTIALTASAGSNRQTISLTLTVL